MKHVHSLLKARDIAHTKFGFSVHPNLYDSWFAVGGSSSSGDHVVVFNISRSRLAIRAIERIRKPIRDRNLHGHLTRKTTLS